MNTIEKIFVDISVVLGSATMPVHQLLRMGRGAVIELAAREEDDCILLANNVPVAKGQVILRGDRIAVSITEMLNRAPDYRNRSPIQRIVPAEPDDSAEPESSAPEEAEETAAEAPAAESVEADDAPTAETSKDETPDKADPFDLDEI